MSDRFEGSVAGLSSPASHAFAVTPSDGVDLPEVTRAVYVGGSGSLVATLSSGSTATFSGLIGGTILPMRIRRIHASGTTATALVGLV